MMIRRSSTATMMRQMNTSHTAYTYVQNGLARSIWPPVRRHTKNCAKQTSKADFHRPKTKTSKLTMAEDAAAAATAADLDTASAKVEAMDIEEKKDDEEEKPAEGAAAAPSPSASASDAATASSDDIDIDTEATDDMPDLENPGDKIEDGFSDDDDKDTPPADPTVAIVEAMAQKEEGNAAFKDGDYTAAVRSYRKGTTLLKPFNKNNTGDEQVKSLLLTLQTNLSMVCYKQDKHKMSRDVATKALEIDPINVKALYRRAVAYRQLGDAESARSDLREALKHEPNNKAVRKEMVSIKKEVEASRAKEKERLQKAFGANKGGSCFLYNDKEEEERRKAEEKKKQEEAQAEALKKRKIVSRVTNFCACVAYVCRICGIRSMCLVERNLIDIPLFTQSFLLLLLFFSQRSGMGR